AFRRNALPLTSAVSPFHRRLEQERTLDTMVGKEHFDGEDAKALLDFLRNAERTAKRLDDWSRHGAANRKGGMLGMLLASLVALVSSGFTLGVVLLRPHISATNAQPAPICPVVKDTPNRPAADKLPGSDGLFWVPLRTAPPQLDPRNSEKSAPQTPSERN